jgi:16S rRNA (adenine1518-N6/adenine1519-N6)-dimethyltransferase
MENINGKNLTDISYIKEIMRKHGFNFSKAMGQNFLTNPSVCPKMAEAALEFAAKNSQEENSAKKTAVIEIGPGIGVLTKELCKRADKVIAVELDKRLLPILQETLAEYGNLQVVNEDVLKVDLQKLIDEELCGYDVCVCANLPYYITTPIIMKLLESELPINSITVMVQKEPAKRLCAKPGVRECGAVSAAVWFYCRPEILFNVSRGSFMPAPNVDSAVIRLNILPAPPVEVADRTMLFRLVKAAFAQRRKTILNAISSGLGISKAEASAKIAQAGVAENLRAEKLTLEDFAKLADNF